NEFKAYEGKTGIVKDFNGTSYTVAFEDGKEVSGIHYSLVSLRKQAEDLEASPFAEEEIIFDESSLIQAYSKGNFVSLKESEKAKVLRLVDQDRARWESLARVDPATSDEDYVPFRLIPEGSEILIPTGDGGVQI